MYVIEDERHAEPMSKFATFEQALMELQRLAALPWNKSPNRAPCTGWTTCGRTYEIVEYDTDQKPWRELCRVPVLQVSASGSVWETGFE